MLDAGPSASDATSTSLLPARAAVRRILRARPSWEALLGAIHDLSGSEEEWARQTLAAARDVFQRGTLACSSRERRGVRGRTTVVFDVVLEDRRGPSATPRPPALALRTRDAHQGVALSVRPTAHRVTVLSATFGRATEVPAYERTVLGRIALYLEAAQRRRLRPELVRGTIDVAPRPGLGAPDRRWRRLLDGELTLVARTLDEGSIAYEVIESADATLRRLTDLERRTLALALDGAPNKEIGYRLALSPSAVSLSLANIAAKLGAVSIVELLRLGGVLASKTSPETSGPTMSPLTSAEEDVLELLRRGLRNGEIASLRRRSVRTVANQVAAILRKTGRASRRALLVQAAPRA